MTKYEEFDGYRELLKQRLSKKRYTHSVNVAQASYKLAELNGGDKKRCYLAGLLHDIMKEEAPELQKQYCAESGLDPDPAELLSPQLWHAVAGGYFVREELKITDTEIIGAIRFHTIARADMPLIEKIVYLGDMISEDRSYKDVDKFRKICYDNLDKAMSVALIYQIQKVTSKCGHIPRYTLDAYNFYLKYNTDKESL